jgi:hypothetical protein
MTGRLTLESLICVAVVTFTPFAIEGWHHLHGKGAAGTALVSGVSGRAAAKTVLYDAGVPVDLILDLRGANPDKRFVIFPRVRAALRSRLKRSEQIERQMGQMREAITQRGIKYVVASDSTDRSGTDSSLLPVLRWDPRFQLVRRYPVTALGETGFRNVYLYENKYENEGAKENQ